MLCLLIAFSCQKEEFPSAEEVFLYIHLPADNITKVGDPGVDHGEWETNINSIALFTIQNSIVNLKTYETAALSKNPQGAYVIPLVMEYGNVEVYAVAYNSSTHSFDEDYTNPDDVYNLKTKRIDELDAGIDSKDYMMNLFSGSRDLTIPMQESVTINLTRLVSKVDVQWDVQDAYDSTTDNFVEVRMSEIAFSGLDFAYFFPNEKNDNVTQNLITTGLYSCNSAISERNGRSYFYTFPEQTVDVNSEKINAKIEFTLSYSYKNEDATIGATDKKYTATFKDNLLPAVWYKVNINVKGMSTSSTNNLVIGDTGTP